MQVIPSAHVYNKKLLCDGPQFAGAAEGISRLGWRTVEGRILKIWEALCKAAGRPSRARIPGADRCCRLSPGPAATRVATLGAPPPEMLTQPEGGRYSRSGRSATPAPIFLRNYVRATS